MNSDGTFDLSSLFDFNVQDVAKAAASKLGIDSAQGVVSAASKAISSSKNPDKQTPVVLEQNPIIQAAKNANSAFSKYSIAGISPLVIVGIGLGAFILIKALRK